jgi:hypothetical protein
MYEHFDQFDTDMHLLKDLVPLGAAELNDIEKAWQGLPAEYLLFLKERGAGLMEDGFHFVFLDKPVDAESEVFKDSEILQLGAVGPVCVFGHDQVGTTFGFDLGNESRIVSIDEYREVTTLDVNFSEFVKELVVSYPDVPS